MNKIIQTNDCGHSEESPRAELSSLTLDDVVRLLPEVIQPLSEIFKTLGDPTRLKILKVLLGGECCVYDIASQIGMEQSAVSHQLRVLRQAHIVSFRKEGKIAWYYLDDEHVFTLLTQGVEHVAHRG